MSEWITMTLGNQLTDEQWNMIADVDFDNTEEVTFHTKNGKDVVFVKRDASDVRSVKWIPVTERLPEEGVHVLCACRANIYSVMKWDGIDWCENPTHIYMAGFVTHWMPLPEPPEGGADG